MSFLVGNVNAVLYLKSLVRCSIKQTAVQFGLIVIICLMGDDPTLRRKDISLQKLKGGGNDDHDDICKFKLYCCNS